MNDQTPNTESKGHTERTRYHHLIEHVQDAIVEFELVDRTPIVRNVNQAFLDVFGYPKSEIVGESLNEWIVPEWLTEEAHALDRQTSSEEITCRRVERETANGLREFLYRGIPIEGVYTSIDGIAIYTDITDISRTERRLKVMNRVLRHNLRNITNVLIGHTSQLLEEIDKPAPEQVGSAATIEEAANELRGLTKEARDINRVLNAQSTEDASIDIVPIVRSIVTDYRQGHPAVNIETSLPDSITINADENVCYCFEPLLDNAIEHNTGQQPEVRVSIEAASMDGWVNIIIDDDGPRIPKDERTVITGETDITQKRHGSGLGLWLVKWATDHFGGELKFETSDIGGNRVRIQLPTGAGPS